MKEADKVIGSVGEEKFKSGARPVSSKKQEIRGALILNKSLINVLYCLQQALSQTIKNFYSTSNCRGCPVFHLPVSYRISNSFARQGTTSVWEHLICLGRGEVTLFFFMVALDDVITHRLMNVPSSSLTVMRPRAFSHPRELHRALVARLFIDFIIPLPTATHLYQEGGVSILQGDIGTFISHLIEGERWRDQEWVGIGESDREGGGEGEAKGREIKQTK